VAASSRRSRAAFLERGAVQRSRPQLRPRRGRLPTEALSVGGVIHTGIDAALQIRDELGPRVADITAIKAGIAKYAANRAGTDYPANMEAAKFNLQYVIAASLVNGVPKLTTFEPEAIKDPRVKALAAMVSVAIDPEFADAMEDYPTGLRSR
jgi:2-methylcitrate dehydratase PrpD